jgi:two-component system chemotaxis response regulator CheB
VPDHFKAIVAAPDAHVRSHLANLIRGIESAEIVTTHVNARLVAAKLKQAPVDLILLDIAADRREYLDILRGVRQRCPDASVVVMSSSPLKDGAAVVEALELGALDYLPAAVHPGDPNAERELRLLLMTIIGLISNRKNMRRARQWAEMRPRFAGTRDPSVRTGAGPTEGRSASEAVSLIGARLRAPRPLARFELLAIGVSTGGPNALKQVIPALPADLGVPVLLVQHMPPFLTASLAASLGVKSRLAVREAVDREEILPNTVYVAPGGKHMVVQRISGTPGGRPARLIGLNTAPPENSCRPAVDVLFRSIAEAYDGATLAVIMTGMGTDGMKGVETLKRKGCFCLSQSEGTCVVYGMPRAVDEARLSDEQVPLERLADRIVELVRAS